ncbi:MAG: hypothetical protein AAGN35_16375 [Bacteroidota bacterium]
MKHKTCISLLLILVMAGMASAQNKRVLANPDEDGVWLVWSPADLAYAGGINVYRQEEGASNWEKVTTNPVEWGQYDLSSWIGGDDERKSLKDIADKLRKDGGLEGMAVALLLVKSVENRAFAQYLNLMYQDRSAAPGKRYRYEIKGVLNGSETSFGTSEVVKAGSFIASPAPADVRAEAGDARLQFSWDHDPAKLTGAHVYYKQGRAGRWQRLNPRVILPTRIDDGKGNKVYPEWLFAADSIRNGVTYTCMVKGVDFFGFETEASEEFELTPVDLTPPKAAEKLKVTAEGMNIQLSWAAPKDKERVGFDIYRRDEQDTTWKKLNDRKLAPLMTNFRDEVKLGGMSYSYRIAALDAAGNENFTDEYSVQIFDLTPPVQVLNLKAKADTGKVVLDWFANPEDDLKGYLVYRLVKGKTGNDTLLLTAQPLDTNHYVDRLPKILKNDLVYFVRATDENYNQGRLSRPVTAKLPDPIPPDAPFLKRIVLENEALKLVWLPNLDVDLAGYQVYRSISEQAPDTAWTALTPRMLSAKDTAFVDAKGDAGQSYFYRLAAFDDSGNRSKFSNAYQGVVNKKRLKAVPQKVAAKYSGKKKRVELSWEAAEQSSLIGFMVYRKAGDKAFAPVSGLIMEKEYTDTKIKPGQAYFYEVRAYDKAGNIAKSRPLRLEIENK